MPVDCEERRAVGVRDERDESMDERDDEREKHAKPKSVSPVPCSNDFGVGAAQVWQNQSVVFSYSYSLYYSLIGG